MALELRHVFIVTELAVCMLHDANTWQSIVASNLDCWPHMIPPPPTASTDPKLTSQTRRSSQATVEDVMGFLRSRGLRPDGEPEHLDLPAKDSAGCSAPDPNADTDADAEPGLPAASFESPADAQARVAREAAETVSAALKAEIEQFRRMHGEDVPLPPTLAGGSSGGSTMSQPPSTTQSAEDVENDVVAELLREQQFEIRSISVDGTVLRTQDS